MLSPGNGAEIVAEPGGYRATVHHTDASATGAKFSVYVGTMAEHHGKPANTIIREPT